MRVDRPPSLDPTWLGSPSARKRPRSWLRSFLVLAVIVGLIASTIVFLSWRRARFVLAVSPITTPSPSECVSILRAEFGGNGFDGLCRRELMGSSLVQCIGDERRALRWIPRVFPERLRCRRKRSLSGRGWTVAHRCCRGTFRRAGSDPFVVLLHAVQRKGREIPGQLLSD